MVVQNAQTFQWKRKAVFTRNEFVQVCPQTEARFWVVGLIRHHPNCVVKLLNLRHEPGMCKCPIRVTDLGFTCPVCYVNMNIPILREIVRNPKTHLDEERSLEGRVEFDHSKPGHETLYGTFFSCPLCRNLYSLENGYLHCVLDLKKAGLKGFGQLSSFVPK